MKESTSGSVLHYIDKISRPGTWLIVVLLTTLLAIIDYFTGYEYSFSLFYLFPVVLSSWRLGFIAGIIISFLSALDWVLANVLAGQTFSSLVVPFWNAATRMGFFVITAYLISQVKKLLAHEQSLARTDALTGAANRRAFYELASYEISRTRRYHRPFTLAYIDLDDFKCINDTLGHQVGDMLLKGIVEVMSSKLRAVDTVARLGGDEFALLLPETSNEAARVVIKKIINAITSFQQGNEKQITLSVGVITIKTPIEDVEDLIQQADQLMYRAKQSGKNSVEFMTIDDRITTF